MREIKFRQWSSGGFHFWGAGEDSFTGPLSNRLNIPSEQFTGLHDKNGKEIYEGDIVSIYNGRLCDDLLEVRWGGQWEYAGFGLWGVRKDCSDGLETKTTWDNLNPLYAKDCEVVGNIHECPNLVAIVNSDRSPRIE